MIDPARGFYDSLDGWPALDRLVENAESEGPYLECKTAGEPRLQPGQRTHLGQALSGFANTMGGVVIWGASTTRHSHSGLDVINQIEPVGNCRSLRQQIEAAAPTLAYPTPQGCVSKTLHPTTGATKGVVVTYVPKTLGDPVQSLADKRFYLRSGAEFVEMPYDILKKMFAATAAPDLEPVFDRRIVEKDDAGAWTIPVTLDNQSSAAATRTKVFVKVLNASACEKIEPEVFRDVSNVNPGDRAYIVTIDEPIFRGLRWVAGRLVVTMKKAKLPKRILRLRISVYSTGMRARMWEMTVQLANTGFSVKKTQDQYLY